MAAPKTPKTPITLHSAEAAELPEVKIIWNAEDARIAGGDTSNSAQGPYVTAYGIAASELSGCKSWAVGSDQTVSLAKSGENWRATRFGWKRKAPGSAATLYEWIPVGPLPASVKTLADLCKHLIDKDAVRYPEAIYHADHLEKDLLGNPANMLFDFWENRSFRHETVKKGFDWHTYSTNPGSIPVIAGTVTISHVLGAVITAPKTSGAPGAGGQKQDINGLWKKVEPHLDIIAAHAARIDALLNMIDQITKERLEIVGKVELLRQIAGCGLEPNGDPLPWKRVSMWCEKLSPALHKELMEIPIDTSGMGKDKFDPGSPTFAQIATPDARKALETTTVALRSLLLTDTDFRDKVLDWAQAALAGFLRGDPVVKQQVGVLTDKLGAGWFSLAAAGDAKVDGEKADAIFSRVKEAPASGTDDVKGISSSEVVLALIGKAAALPKAYELLEGPASFRCAATTAWATWRYQMLAEDAFAAISGVSSSADISFTTVKWKAFGDELVELLPPETRATVKKAMAAGNVDSLDALKKVVAEEVEKACPLPIHYTGSMVLLNFITMTLSVREVVAKPNNRATLVKFIDWTDLSINAASLSLGTLDYVLKVSGRIASEGLKRLTVTVNAVAACFGVFKGIVAAAQARAKGDVYAEVGAWVETAGSAAAAYGIYLFLTGAVVSPVVGQVILVFALLSGTISIGDIVRKTLPPTNKFVLGLIQSVTAKKMTSYAIARDANIGRWFKELTDYIDISAGSMTAAKLPFFANDFFVVQDLRKLCVSNTHLLMLVNHGGAGLANNILGPGLPPGKVPGAPAATP